MTRLVNTSMAMLVPLFLALSSCSGSSEQNQKNAAQAKLEAWAEERDEFVAKHCKGKDVDCIQLMREAGLDKPGKVNY